MDLSVHTAVADRLISLFLARGYASTRNSLGMLLKGTLTLKNIPFKMNIYVK